MQGPGSILTDNNITLTSAVDAANVAVLNAEHRVQVNGQFYFVSSSNEKALFLKAPHLYTGALPIPGSMERFEPTADSKRQDVDGQIQLLPAS